MGFVGILLYLHALTDRVKDFVELEVSISQAAGYRFFRVFGDAVIASDVGTIAKTNFIREVRVVLQSLLTPDLQGQRSVYQFYMLEHAP